MLPVRQTCTRVAVHGFHAHRRGIVLDLLRWISFVRTVKGARFSSHEVLAFVDDLASKLDAGACFA